jgi:endonuclease/exonuclease/phosphatase family metal-dependent hydrolase
MRIAAWNIAGGLSKPEKESKIKDGIAKLNADIVILSEAFDKSGVSVDLDYATNLGYQEYKTEYQDKEPHRSERQFVVALSRVAVETSILHLATRNVISLTTDNDGEPLQIIGAHFDDRNETFRQGMAKSFIEQVDLSKPTVLAGDLNSMHKDNNRAVFFSNPLFRVVGHYMPIARPRSLMTRLSEMADGGTQAILTDAGLEESDSKQQPTMLFMGIGIAQLDHVLHTSDVVGSNFQTHHLDGSDHKAISVDIVTSK